MQVGVPIGPAPPSSPRLEYLEKHWSHASDLRKLCQASDSDESDQEQQRETRASSMPTKKQKLQDKKAIKKHGRHRRKHTERNDPPPTKESGEARAPRLSIILPPRIAGCRTLPQQYRPLPQLESSCYNNKWYDGQLLKPGLNLSPRKLEKSPISPASSASTAALSPSPRPAHTHGMARVPPSFSLDG